VNKILSKTPAIGVLLFCLAVFTPARSSWGAASVRDIDREIAAQEQAIYELRQRIQQHNEAAGGQSRQARALQTRLSDLQHNAEIAQQQINLLELQSGRLQNSINALSMEMAEISSQKDNLVRELGFRLVNMYKYGAREELNLLLSAQDANEAVVLVYLMGRLAHHDRFAIEELMAKVTGLERGKHNIERNKGRLMMRVDELDSLREEYAAAIDQTTALLSGVLRERQRSEAAAREMEQAQFEVERALAGLVRQKREHLQSDSPVAGDSQIIPAPVLGRETLLDWPVRGDIVNHYGPRAHPDSDAKTFNSGIGISAPSGTPVRAAGPGVVLHEGWLQGFGQVVIIDHGRNISTVYAHLATTRVRESDVVMPGTVIGTVGNTGAAGGYVLHFEVRVGGSAENPLDYLKRI